MTPPLPFEAPEFFDADHPSTFPAFMFLAAADWARAAKEPFWTLPLLEYAELIMRRAAAPSMLVFLGLLGTASIMKRVETRTLC